MNVKFCLSRTPSFSTERDKTEYLFSMADKTNKKATLGQLSGSSSRLQPPGIIHPLCPHQPVTFQAVRQVKLVCYAAEFEASVS